MLLALTSDFATVAPAVQPVLLPASAQCGPDEILANAGTRSEQCVRKVQYDAAPKANGLPSTINRASQSAIGTRDVSAAISGKSGNTLFIGILLTGVLAFILWKE